MQKKWTLSYPSKLRSAGCDKTAMNSHLDKQTLELLKEETPLGTIGTTEDVAQMVGFLASDHSDFITGQVFGINGGMVI
ncbi:MAG: SDR family oxidoreductase [Acutalibacteraceae bacterium]